MAREAAALGLARLGASARDEIARRLGDRSTVVRRAALLASAQSCDSGTVAFLRRGFSDKDAFVRMSAVAALDAISSPYYEAQRAAAVPELKRLAAADSDRSVAVSAARVLGQIAPASP